MNNTGAADATLAIRVIAVSDNLVWRGTVRRRLLSDRAFNLLGEATCSSECIELCGEYMPDLLILGTMAEDRSFVGVVEAEYPSVQMLSQAGLSSDLEWQESVLSSVIDVAELKRLALEFF